MVSTEKITDIFAEVLAEIVIDNSDFNDKHPRNKDGTFANKLAAKLTQMAKDYKNGKCNPKRYTGEVVKMNNLDNDEREFVYSIINTDLSDEEKLNGIATRRLYNEKLKRDYLYYIEYDENGKHNVKRYYISDDIY